MRWRSAPSSARCSIPATGRSIPSRCWARSPTRRRCRSIGERGRARHGVRQHQRVRRGRGGVGGDGPRQPREAGEDAPQPGGGDLLRLEPGAGREHRQGGSRGRPASGAVGPRAAAHGRGGAGMRLPARFPRDGRRSRRRATCRATRSCSSAPAARASRAPRWPSSRPASIATWCWRTGDSAIFSSRVIPGNERSVGRLQNALMARGVEVITDGRRSTSMSPAIPARDELVRMYQWVRPKIALPVHGEVRHMIEHAALARECQVPETVLAPNGTLVRLAPGPADDHRPCPCRPAGARRRHADRPRAARRCASGASCCGTARPRRPW